MRATYSIAAVFAVCLTGILAQGTDEELIEAYVLPNTTFPTFYDVQLFIDPEFTGYFLGNVTIRIIPNVATDEIVLHAMETDILSVTVFSELTPALDVFESYTLATDDTHLLRIKLSSIMTVWQPHTININYVSRFADNMFGVYLSTYTESNGNRVSLVTSQLQPTFARRAFPCYDEPYYKAVFRTTIYAPADFPIVRSNMPLRTDLLKPDQPGYVKHEFEDTLIMSSYLNAYLISEFNYVENADNLLYRIPFKVYSRPGTQDFAQFALEFGQRNMVALEEYTGFPYNFPKLDKVAVPDFAAGAMENWGLIIYREAALLVQTGVTTTSSRQGVGRIICHENMHQWFGNEVSPVSWTYTWLNEGFANFFERYATDFVLPEWRMMDQFVINMQDVFQSDAVLTVNSMTHGVYTPSQILATFNSVAYQKSGSVIRMMQHALTPEVFREGLRLYLQSHSRRAVVPSDLYEALQEALDASSHSLPLSVASIMDTWATQSGFPVITLTRTSPTADSLMAQQERYLTDRTLSSNSLWPVPLNWVLSSNPEFSTTSPDSWMLAQTIALDIPGLSSADWYMFNKQQTGYYRINYDEQNWQALVRVMQSSPSIIPVLNRAQLVDDSFNLARNGRLNYEYPLELSRYLSSELDYIPWASANAAFTYLNTVLSGSSVYGLFQQYILELTSPLYQRLGFIATPTEEHVTAFHRTIILNFNCRFGNPECVNTASQLLENLRNNPAETLNPDIQTSVFCSGLRGGDVDNFNFLWSRYVASTDSSEQSILLNALGCSTNAQTRDFYLNQVISPESAVREQDRNTVLVAVINSSPENMEVAFDFIIENFSAIQSSVQSLTGTTSVLNALANVLTTEEHRNKIDSFYTRYEGSFSAGELASLNLIRENIAATITWNSQNLGIVENWLNVNIGGVTPAPDTPEVPLDLDSSAGVVTGSCLVLLSVALVLRQDL